MRRCEHFSGNATRIAQDIRQRVWQQLRITVSAGVAGKPFELLQLQGFLWLTIPAKRHFATRYKPVD